MLTVEGASKRYGSLLALAPLGLTIARSERVAIVGPSGSGKTTLLHLLAGMLQPDSGRILMDGNDLARLHPGRELARLVGLIHQQYDLVPNLAVVHNVLAGKLGRWGLLKTLLSLAFPQDADEAYAALRRVGIGEKLYERTSRLSGGEQQRVALARLLVQNPQTVLADEPVASVDPARAEDLVQLLVDLARENGQTLVVSLHTVSLAFAYFERVIGLRGGRVVFDLPTSEVTDAALQELYALDMPAPVAAGGS